VFGDTSHAGIAPGLRRYGAAMPVEENSPTQGDAEVPVCYGQYVNGKMTRIVPPEEARRTAATPWLEVTGDLDTDGIRFSDHYPGQGLREFHIVQISEEKAMAWRETVQQANMPRRNR
jgi:hypothetical protein